METVDDPERDGLVERARGVRGVVAAVLVDSAGEVVASDSDDPGLLGQMRLTATSALAASEAFSDLLPSDDPPNLTAIYDDGRPLIFTPVADGSMTLVVAVESAVDIGRARFQLKRITGG